AAEVAATGLLVTIGIEPTHASTGFGYIRGGDALPGFATARVVTEFVEKPDAARAEAYVRSREYRWNAGMFLARASTLLDLLAENHQELAAGLRAIAADPALLPEVWPGLTKIAIDHAVAEPAAAAGRVAMVPGPFGWEDLGDFSALAAMTPGAAHDVKVIGDESLVLTGNASGLVVPAAGRTVAVIGLEDVVVVDTGDALLVTTYAHAQDVKAIVDELKQRGRTDLT
ncbi:MAG: sugar phosphate nucleotidyltransferase, partial [Marmoricola sp.]